MQETCRSLIVGVFRILALCRRLIRICCLIQSVITFGTISTSHAGPHRSGKSSGSDQRDRVVLFPAVQRDGGIAIARRSAGVVVVRHESNVSSAARSKLLMATRVACFGQSPEFLKEVSDGLAEQSEAAVAGRFLIEYVAARPPKGLRPLSLSVYDALLARAAIITTYGMLSDIVHFQIARVDVDMLGAGRLGFRPDQYRAAMQDYRMRFAAAQATHAAERFRKQWQQPQSADEEWRQDVEAATQAEFGFPLSRLVELLSFAIEIGLQNPPIVRMRYEDAVSAFAAQDGWDQQQAEAALQMFLYRPRNNFLKPGGDYRWRMCIRGDMGGVCLISAGRSLWKSQMADGLFGVIAT